jgi:hypothetical protein
MKGEFFELERLSEGLSQRGPIVDAAVILFFPVLLQPRWA